MSLLENVTDLAKQVSAEILLPSFAKVIASEKSDGSWLTKADIKTHEALCVGLPKIIDYPVLSEEMTIDDQQIIISSASSSYWCIDPLDGTTNFTTGTPYWCMSIALIENGNQKFAVVYDPNRDECFAASDITHATLNGCELENWDGQATTIAQSVGLIDFKRLDSVTASSLATNPPYRSQRSFGASALDFCWIATGRCQLYLHGNQKLWDYSAGLLILQQAGGKAENFRGEAIFQNNLQPKSVIAASNEDLMIQWKSYINSISIN